MEAKLGKTGIGVRRCNVQKTEALVKMEFFKDLMCFCIHLLVYFDPEKVNGCK